MDPPPAAEDDDEERLRPRMTTSKRDGEGLRRSGGDEGGAWIPGLRPRMTK